MVDDRERQIGEADRSQDDRRHGHAAHHVAVIVVALDHEACAKEAAGERQQNHRVAEAPAGTIDCDEVIAAADPAKAAAYAEANPVASDEVFTIFWTSGTEARPRL